MPHGKRCFFSFFTIFFSFEYVARIYRPEIIIIRYQQAYIYGFERFQKFRKNIFFAMFHDVWDQSCVLFGFVVSSRALLLQNASFLTHLYLGKSYAYRKRTVKHISKLNFSDRKNANLPLVEKCQLAENAPVLLEIGGELST